MTDLKPICSICGEPHWSHERHVWLPLAVLEARAAAAKASNSTTVTKAETAELLNNYARAREERGVGRNGRPRVYASNAERQRAYRARLSGIDKEGRSHDGG